MKKKILPEPFVEQERSRVFEPDPGFAARVVARLHPVTRATTAVWDHIPPLVRPLVAATAMLLLIVLGIQVILPSAPSRSVVDAYLEGFSAPADDWLYRDAELPDGHDLLVEIAVPEEAQ